ncbi:hypothetical protein RLOC_00007283 [Lonchura striata]|uniref:Uncharacterized protein n=1 Tax=Lonchura striata TaxID=40157 RepID=A0A218VBM0_9PASE|nr:hypothetical protein RLOC_00007283 [Lonchura striata domestica]
MWFCLFAFFDLNSKYNTQIILTGRPVLFLMPDILPELMWSSQDKAAFLSAIL